jgi:hypothetical protein
MKGGYALDSNQGGFGLISLGYHSTASHSDPLTDHLYLVLDEVNEPTDALLPVPPAPVTADGLTIFQFDADETVDMTYQWKGKLHLMPVPTTLHFAKVRAGDVVNLLFRTYADGVLVDTQVIDATTLQFRLPGADSHESYEFELIGTSSVRMFVAAEDVKGLE